MTTILLMDRAHGAVHALRTVLEHEGYDVFLVNADQDLLTVLRSVRVDLIFISDDWSAEDAPTGAQLCHQLKHTPLYQALPVVMYGQNLRLYHRDYLAAIGADAALPHPAAPAAVLAMARRFLSPSQVVSG